MRGKKENRWRKWMEKKGMVKNEEVEKKKEEIGE